MGNADVVYARWRKNAAEQWRDDRYTVLWNELVATWRMMHGYENDHEAGMYDGLILAYSLLTGDSPMSVGQMVARAAREPVAS